MIEVIIDIERIPKSLLDEYSTSIWLGATHRNTFIRPHCVHLHTFQMWAHKFVLLTDAFHEEVRFWPMVIGEIREGKYPYFLDEMLPLPLPGETVANTRKWIDKHDLCLVLTQMKNQMSFLKETIMSITISSGLVPNSAKLQGFTQKNPLVTTALVVTIPPI